MTGDDVPDRPAKETAAAPGEWRSLDWEETTGPASSVSGSEAASFLPSFVGKLPASQQAPLPGYPNVGERIDDFELLGELGRGASGVVFLARQMSLGRLVALKATADFGQEARTLARLEHRHIVAVYSEQLAPAGNLRLVCMQYVPGTALDAVLDRLREMPRDALSGETLLAVIDEVSLVPALFDAEALRDRQMLSESSYIEATCWIGARLAEALDYAHQCGVIHRDIKPANILLDPYGRPLLADFNLSYRDTEKGAPGEEVFGGTLAYMAPEHLDAFASRHAPGAEAVDQRSDIYSLGVVLFEMLALARPFCDELPQQKQSEVLRLLAEQRRGELPKLAGAAAPTPEVVEHVVRRCLAPAPEERFATAGELAAALDGCRRFLKMQQRLPRMGRTLAALVRRPFLGMTLMGAAAHLAGNVFTPLYNAALVFPGYAPQQKWAFFLVVVAYGLTIFPIAFAVMAAILAPSVRVWRATSRGQWIDRQHVEWARRQALRSPWYAIFVSCLGWWPLLLAMPWGLRAAGAPMPPGHLPYFVFSVLFSWLGAAAWTYFTAQLFLLRVFYPRLWSDAQDYRRTAAAELRGVGARLRMAQLLLGMAPLAVAVLMVFVSPSAEEVRWHRMLIVTAVAAGVVAFHFATTVTRYLEKTVDALLDGAPSIR